MRSLAAMTMAVGMSAVPASSANATAPGGPPPCDPPGSGFPHIPCDPLPYHVHESHLGPDAILSLGGAEYSHSVGDYDSVMGVVAWSQPQIGLSCADGPTCEPGVAIPRLYGEDDWKPPQVPICGNDDLLPLPTPHSNNTLTLNYIPACGPRDSGVCGGTPWPDLQWWNFGVDMTASGVVGEQSVWRSPVDCTSVSGHGCDEPPSPSEPVYYEPFHYYNSLDLSGFQTLDAEGNFKPIKTPPPPPPPVFVYVNPAAIVKGQVAWAVTKF